MAKKTTSPTERLNSIAAIYVPRNFVGAGERRLFRALLGPLPEKASADGSAVIDADFAPFCNEVDDILSRHFALPDADQPAIRSSAVRDSANQLLSGILTLRAQLEPSTPAHRNSWEVLRVQLCDAGWHGEELFHPALDDLQDAVEVVAQHLAATDPRRRPDAFA